MLMEARELGFEQAELSHGTRVDLVPGIVQAVEEGVIAISSVHNFCPLPGSVKHAAPNLFQPSSRSKSERSQWLMHSERTLEFAARVGARHVVMHSGSMAFRFRSPLPVFAAALESGLAQLTKDRSVFAPDERDLAKARERLHREAATAIRRVIAAYTDLVPAAARHGVVLGAENREGFPELPLDDGFDDFFNALPPESPVGYWHDTGHAQIKHLAGLLDHEQHLGQLADRLIGFHLHDVSMAGKDHQVPGSGSVDFAMIARFIRPEHTLVLEPSPKLTAAEISSSRDYLLDILVN